LLHNIRSHATKAVDIDGFFSPPGYPSVLS
jgi:hypothetical protein